MADAPVKVTGGEAEFLHTVAVPATVAVGKGFSVTIALPETVPPDGQAWYVTDTRVYDPGTAVWIR